MLYSCILCLLFFLPLQLLDLNRFLQSQFHHRRWRLLFFFYLGGNDLGWSYSKLGCRRGGAGIRKSKGGARSSLEWSRVVNFICSPQLKVRAHPSSVESFTLDLHIESSSDVPKLSSQALSGLGYAYIVHSLLNLRPFGILLL